MNGGERVDVIGASKGRGFAGTIKRHGFARGPKTHGQSDRMRSPGSIGMCATPGRTLKGKKMAGRMGNDRVTVQNLPLVVVDAEKEPAGGQGVGARRQGQHRDDQALSQARLAGLRPMVQEW